MRQRLFRWWKELDRLDKIFYSRIRDGLIVFFVIVCAKWFLPPICPNEPNVWSGAGYQYPSTDENDQHDLWYFLAQKHKSDTYHPESEHGYQKYIPSGICKEELKLTDLLLALFTYYL